MRHWSLPAGIAAFLIAVGPSVASREIDVWVDFGRPLRIWDGFGVNYVETAQTRDYKAWPQEYGGFSTLSEKQRQEILDLIFGPDGLRPGVVKMFLDPFHEPENDNADPYRIDAARFDHQSTTRWMRYFVRGGLERTRAQGGDLRVITTLYGPPAWMTVQKFVRGRDLDPAMKEELAEYLAAWVKYLREVEKFPVLYVSLHNEGEDLSRWPVDGKWGGYPHHDYNLYWPSSQVAEMIPIVRKVLDANGLADVGVAPGETTTWERFALSGYAWAIRQSPQALRGLGLITSHGFGSGRSTNSSLGVDLLRLERPELHACTTSMTWGRMDAQFLEFIRQQIYWVGVNAVIPWACIQTDSWVGGDPNPGTAIRVDGKGGYQVLPGYHYYKHVCRAGQPGMAVAHVDSDDPNVGIIAFASNGTRHPDAVVLFNTSSGRRDLVVHLSGTRARSFDGFETSPGREFHSLGRLEARDGAVWISLSAGAVVSLRARID